MAKTLKCKRAVFSTGKQSEFIERVQKILLVKDIARVGECSERTVRDWRREKFHMPLATVYTLCKRTNTAFPKNIKSRDEYAHTARAGKLGYAAVVKKYGELPKNEQVRKNAWRQWWKTTGRFKRQPLLESIAVKKPRRGIALAEFIGIMMGDGGMSRYQATVTLHHIDDLAYSAFVAQRIKELFGYTPSIRHREEDSTVGVVISRREIVEYLHTLGLPVGNKIKQGLDMPSWIKKNHAFSIACVRGLVDTDGSIFTHHYKVNGKWYAYKKLCFTSASPTLVLSVHKVLRDLKLHARISRNGRDARLESISDMERYFKLIGTHNPKHLRRYSL